MFQFHSGSIKRRAAFILAAPSKTFQFHSGSIKSAPSAVEAKANAEFQFHSGSIKRERKRTIAKFLYLSFNSIVVRLKDVMRFSHACQIPCFNSIVVRLKVGRIPYLPVRRRCFNSIVVRLKGRFFARDTFTPPSVSIP